MSLVEINNVQAISLYIHWPFCLSLCPYCDFNSHVTGAIDHDAWLIAYKKEIDYFADKIKGREVRSIFFGGGTPSLMKPHVVEGIIAKIGALGKLSDNIEITLEANPTSYETQKFKEFKAAGVNRVSIGVQSLNQDALTMLGRKHSANDAIKAIESASKIYDRYSFDLIYAIPGQTLEQWQEQATEGLKLAGDHISLYQLTIEKGTPFYSLYRNGNLKMPSNDLAASMYEWTNEHLKARGYNRYEISNYAKAGEECIHNLCYWNYNEYIGIGPGAHARLHNSDGVEAIMMTHKPEKWLNLVADNGHGIQSRNKLTNQETVEEIIMMGTRLEQGVNESNLYKLTGKKFADILNTKTLEHYMQQGLVVIENGNLRLSSKGLMLHNYLLARMLG